MSRFLGLGFVQGGFWGVRLVRCRVLNRGSL